MRAPTKFLIAGLALAAAALFARPAHGQGSQLYYSWAVDARAAATVSRNAAANSKGQLMVKQANFEAAHEDLTEWQAVYEPMMDPEAAYWVGYYVEEASNNAATAAEKKGLGDGATFTANAKWAAAEALFGEGKYYEATFVYYECRDFANVAKSWYDSGQFFIGLAEMNIDDAYSECPQYPPLPPD